MIRLCIQMENLFCSFHFILYIVQFSTATGLRTHNNLYVLHLPFATLCRVASKADIRASFIQNSQEMSCETSFVLREKGSLFCESKKRNCNVKRKNSVHLKLKFSSFTVKAKVSS